MTLQLKPKRGGFLRPFGCGEFIRKFLLGYGPNGSPRIDPMVGAPQADICYRYKIALIKTTAVDKATRHEEKQARREKRAISPEEIERLTERYLAHIPYKTTSCRYHSFVVYFSNLQRLGWVEPTAEEEPSSFQEHYSPGQPRKYFRLTKAGKKANDSAWGNPHRVLYGQGKVDCNLRKRYTGST